MKKILCVFTYTCVLSCFLASCSGYENQTDSNVANLETGVSLNKLQKDSDTDSNLQESSYSTNDSNTNETISETIQSSAKTSVKDPIADTFVSDHSKNISSTTETTLEDTPVATTNIFRSNTSLCLVPEASGEEVTANSVASIDSSNCSEGYICVSYFGTCSKVKLQITCDQKTTYTYNLYSGHGYETFPLSEGSGTYNIVVYENVYDNQYAAALSLKKDILITNEFGPNLYPNQYVTFTKDSKAVKKAADLVQNCKDDLDAVSEIYNFVSQNVVYDYDKAATVQSGYTPNVDDTLESLRGICLDYASLMCAMLRSQRIPTRLEVGYAGTAYHAWISTYISEIGWVNGIIQFDGKNWKIMDPTFAATTDPQQLKSFISDSDNYQTKYIY